MLSVAEPVLGAEEKCALAAVIDSGWITMGERVDLFEKRFAALQKASDGVAVCSATAGLHLALHALGIGPGDEVLVPSLTFVASANSVLYVGASPVFVDIEAMDRPLMSMDDARSKCTPRTKAIMLVHYAGYTVEREAWRALAKERGLHIVEDAAHAAGLTAAGKIGDIAVFSFYGNKNMTTAEGGMVISENADLLAKVRQLRGHGLTSGTFQRHKSGSSSYDVTMLGFNYRMDELRASIGLVQLDRLRVWNEQRRLLTDLYRRLIGQKAPSIVVPFGARQASSYHIMPVVLPERAAREQVAEQMRQCGIQTSIHYPAVHQLSFYRSKFPEVRLPLTEAYSARELTLPLHPRLEAKDVQAVVAALSRSL